MPYTQSWQPPVPRVSRDGEVYTTAAVGGEGTIGSHNAEGRGVSPRRLQRGEATLHNAAPQSFPRKRLSVGADGRGWDAAVVRGEGSAVGGSSSRHHAARLNAAANAAALGVAGGSDLSLDLDVHGRRQPPPHDPALYAAHPSLAVGFGGGDPHAAPAPPPASTRILEVSGAVPPAPPSPTPYVAAAAHADPTAQFSAFGHALSGVGADGGVFQPPPLPTGAPAEGHHGGYDDYGAGGGGGGGGGGGDMEVVDTQRFGLPPVPSQQPQALPVAAVPKPGGGGGMMPIESPPVIGDTCDADAAAIVHGAAPPRSLVDELLLAQQEVRLMQQMEAPHDAPNSSGVHVAMDASGLPYVVGGEPRAALPQVRAPGDTSEYAMLLPPPLPSLAGGGVGSATPSPAAAPAGQSISPMGRAATPMKPGDPPLTAAAAAAHRRSQHAAYTPAYPTHGPPPVPPLPAGAGGSRPSQPAPRFFIGDEELRGSSCATATPGGGLRRSQPTQQAAASGNPLNAAAQTNGVLSPAPPSGSVKRHMTRALQRGEQPLLSPPAPSGGRASPVHSDPLVFNDAGGVEDVVHAEHGRFADGADAVSNIDARAATPFVQGSTAAAAADTSAGCLRSPVRSAGSPASSTRSPGRSPRKVTFSEERALEAAAADSEDDGEQPAIPPPHPNPLADYPPLEDFASMIQDLKAEGSHIGTPPPDVAARGVSRESDYDAARAGFQEGGAHAPGDGAAAGLDAPLLIAGGCVLTTRTLIYAGVVLLLTTIVILVAIFASAAAGNDSEQPTCPGVVPVASATGAPTAARRAGTYDLVAEYASISVNGVGMALASVRGVAVPAGTASAAATAQRIVISYAGGGSSKVPAGLAWVTLPATAASSSPAPLTAAETLGAGLLRSPRGVAARVDGGDGAAEVWVADDRLRMVFALNPLYPNGVAVSLGEYLTPPTATAGSSNATAGGSLLRFDTPTAMAVTPDGTTFLVLDALLCRVSVVTSGGAFQRAFGDCDTLASPIDLAVYGEHVYVLTARGIAVYAHASGARVSTYALDLPSSAASVLRHHLTGEYWRASAQAISATPDGRLLTVEGGQLRLRERSGEVVCHFDGGGGRGVAAVMLEDGRIVAADDDVVRVYAPTLVA